MLRHIAAHRSVQRRFYANSRSAYDFMIPHVDEVLCASSRSGSCNKCCCKILLENFVYASDENCRSAFEECSAWGTKLEFVSFF